MGLYRVTISNNISSESTHQIHSPYSCILLLRVSTKVVQRTMKFQILEFCYFCWGKYLMYTGFFRLLGVQVQFGVIRGISDFCRLCIFKIIDSRDKRTNVGLCDKYLVYAKYL